MKTMKSTVWEGMMVIVPSFAEANEADDPIVPAFIGRCKWAFPECVANGVYTPGDMCCEEYAHCSSPEETGESAEKKGDEESKEHPEEGELVDEDECRVFEEMWSNDVGISKTFSGEEPSEVCMPEAVEWAMGIPFFIRVCMVDDVGGYPCNGVSFECPSTCDEEETP